MPLLSGKSKKAFEHNIKTEMSHGKPQDQALAIAYSMKRKKKKMAKGGEVNESAVTEQRPMPEETDKDASMVSRNDAKKPLVDSQWVGQPTVEQARKPSRTPLKHPKMVPSNVFSTRLRDQEDDLMESASPGPYGAQPPQVLDEEDADKQGPSVPALEMKMMADGGMIDEEDESPEEEEEEIEHAASIAAEIMARRHIKDMYAEGGEIHSHDSIYSDDSDQADLSRNADEDANEEDQLSFNSLRKENYSESEGLMQLDSPMDSNEHGDEREDAESDPHEQDMISSIRRKMKSKSPISR